MYDLSWIRISAFQSVSNKRSQRFRGALASLEIEELPEYRKCDEPCKITYDMRILIRYTLNIFYSVLYKEMEKRNLSMMRVYHEYYNNVTLYFLTKLNYKRSIIYFRGNEETRYFCSQLYVRIYFRRVKS